LRFRGDERSKSAPAHLHLPQDRRRRPAIDLESILLLIVAERCARQHAGVAVDLVVIKAPRGEDLLHADEIGSRTTSACPQRIL
jgi:hypothetical protein